MTRSLGHRLALPRLRLASPRLRLASPRPRLAVRGPLAGALCACALLFPASALAGVNPADQPPFGGAPVLPLMKHAPPDLPPNGFRLSPRKAIAIAARTPQVRGERAHQRLKPRAGTLGRGRWQLDFYDRSGNDRAQVVLRDRNGSVVEAWTGRQVATPLARGYPGAVAGIPNRIYIWLPLCALFLAPFFDPRRPLRLLHLDLLVMLSFGASQIAFNNGDIGLSVPLVYPVLGYIFVRMLATGLRKDGARERSDHLIPLVPASALVVAIIALAAFRVGVNVNERNVIDVGYAGVAGAERLSDGMDIYSASYWKAAPVRGDAYGPANYVAYLPFESAFPWSGRWDDLPAARAAAIAFDLLTALGLFALGRRLRRGKEGRMLGLALSFAWLAYPYTLFTLDSSFNDSLVALSLVAALLAIASPLRRGALAAFGGLTKFGTLALVPLLATGTGERRRRSLIVFCAAFAAVTILLIVPALPHDGLRELYDRSLGYQASRSSPFSIWGLAPGLKPLQDVAKGLAVALALLFAFVPRRRSVFQLAALAAAVLVALQVAASHWLYPYVVWFAPLVFLAIFSSYRGPEPATQGTGASTRPLAG